MELIVFIAVLAIFLAWLFYVAVKKASLYGARATLHEIVRVMSAHYDLDDSNAPTKLEEIHNSQKNGKVKGLNGFLIIADEIMGVLGDEIYFKGEKSAACDYQPTDGRIRVDLLEDEIGDLHFLAHMGFEFLISDQENLERLLRLKSSIEFKEKEDAEKASSAIDQLFFNLPKEKRCADDASADEEYALSINRDHAIWKKWRDS